MPFKAADLKKAIDDGDLAQIRRVLEQRDSKGNPTVDINNICPLCPNCTEEKPQCESCATKKTCYTCSAYKERSACPNRSAWHYTLFSKMDGGKKYEILLALLAVRNSHNDPTIDLERTNGLRQTALEAVLGHTNTIQPVTKGPSASTIKNFSVAEARQLVYKIINLRTHLGNLVVHVSPTKQFIGTLNQSILLGDPEIVRMVLDLRDDDGFYAIDVYQVLHWGYYNLKQTPLDIAYSGSYWRKGGNPQHVVNQKIVDLLKKAGALRYSELQTISLADQKKRQLERMKNNQEESKACCEEGPLGPEKKDECSGFFENKQNIHLNQVEQTVDNSIVKLKEYYKALSLDEKEYAKTIREIESFLETIQDEHPNYVYIKKGLDFVKSCHDAVHPISGLTMAQVLILVWTGVNNAEALLESHMEYGNIVEFRRNRFLDELQEIATTYRRGGDFAVTCISGARARLVKTLSYLHPDVFISHTKEEAIELFFTRLDTLQTAAIATYPYEQKRVILASWPQLAEVQPGESKSAPAYEFVQQTYPKIKEELESEFKNSVDQTIIDGAMANYPMPIVHKALNALIQQINALIPDDKSSQPLKKIQEHTKNVFIEKHQTFDEDYKWLNDQYQDYQLLRQLVDKIKVLAVDRNDPKQIKSHLKNLKFSFQKLWNALPENDVNAVYVNQIKKLIQEFHKDTNVLANILKLEEALSALDKNKKLAKFIKNILPNIFANLAFFKLQPEKKENPVYKKLAGKLTEKIDLYTPDSSFKKNHELLHGHYQSYNELIKLAKKIESIEYKGDNFFTKLTIQLQEKISAINVDCSFLENHQKLNRCYQFYGKLVELHARMAAISRKHPVFPLALLEQLMLNHFDDVEQDVFLTACSHKIDYFEEISSYMATKTMPIYLIESLEKNIDDYAKSEKKEIKLNRAEAKGLTGRLEKIVQIDNAVVTLTEHVDKWDEKDENKANAIRAVEHLAFQMRTSIALSIMNQEQFDSKNFVNELNVHITEAKPVLETHRGMKDAFSYFMLSILTAGTALLFLTGRKVWHWYHHTPNFVFFPPLTDTELIKKAALLTAVVDRCRP